MDLQTQAHLGGNGLLNFNGEACNGNDGKTDSFNRIIMDVIEWLNGQLPDLNVPANSSLEDLRVCLQDGTVLCHLLNRLSPGAVEMDRDLEPQAMVERFLSTLDKMGLPRFEVSDLEQGSMIKILEWLLVFKSNFSSNIDREAARNHVRKKWNVPEIEDLDTTDHSQPDALNSTKFGPNKRRNSWESKFQTVLRSTTLSDNLGPDVKVSELMKWNNLDKLLCNCCLAWWTGFWMKVRIERVGMFLIVWLAF